MEKTKPIRSNPPEADVSLFKESDRKRLKDEIKRFEREQQRRLADLNTPKIRVKKNETRTQRKGRHTTQ